ncbi:MAG: hypothetical protein J6Q81_06550, partial [Lentisphaeria bacterium]|nr:hypothetical protein [Lentisphaeria bacterium]
IKAIPAKVFGAGFIALRRAGKRGPRRIRLGRDKVGKKLVQKGFPPQYIARRLIFLVSFRLFRYR